MRSNQVTWPAPVKLDPAPFLQLRPTIVRATRGGREDSLHLLCLQFPDLSLDSTPFSPQFNKGPLCLKPQFKSLPCLFQHQCQPQHTFCWKNSSHCPDKSPPWNWPLSSLPVNPLRSDGKSWLRRQHFNGYTDNVKLSKALKLAPRDVKVGLVRKHYYQPRDF